MTKLFKLFLHFFIIILLSNLAFSTTEVVNVKVTEYVNEQTTYDPLGASSGLYSNSGETKSYTISGEIFIENVNAIDSIESIKVALSSIQGIYNISYSSGNFGFVGVFDTIGDNLELYVPDLGIGENSSFTYNINSSYIKPLINFTTSYTHSSTLSGLSFGVTDLIVNNLNSSLYSSTCISNLQIFQKTKTVTQSIPIDFTFDTLSLTGLDSANASFSDNRTLTWNVLNNNCINSGENLNISYDINVPNNFESDGIIDFLNSTISYTFNESLSSINIDKITAVADVNLEFNKFQVNVLQGDNATWRVRSFVESDTSFIVNLTKVTMWVSERNFNNTGFTNPSSIDVDTISGASLQNIFTPGILLNSTNPWDNVGTELFFNYTYSSSPIVWMDIENTLHDDGTQMKSQTESMNGDIGFTKRIYVATGYWLEITKNITRISDSNYRIDIKVSNLGNLPTPRGQSVVVYNFIPNDFNLTSSLVFSNSPWYNTQDTNTTLNDPIYNGTMFQFALLHNLNPSNSSLDKYLGTENINNTWTLTYNISGIGQFAFDDLFLTGVDPLKTGTIGGTQGIKIKGDFKSDSSVLRTSLVVVASILGILIVLL